MKSSDAAGALKALWSLAGFDERALQQVVLTGVEPVLPSSFAVATAAQVAVAGAALAACELAHMRGSTRQQVSVDMAHAALECTGAFTIDGRAPELFDALSGLYEVSDGWVRVHANFEHHRRGALALIGVDPGTTDRRVVELAATRWKAVELESAAAQAGLVITALRSFDEWDATPQAEAIASEPLFTMEKIGEAEPLELASLAGRDDALPLDGVRVLDLTRILAGPVGGRTLAGYGADVMLVNSPNLPNIDAIMETSRGKLSTLIDLHDARGRHVLATLLGDAHVMVQGYRPGGLEQLGFGAPKAARIRPGIVYVSLSAYGRTGPWSGRRGFDSLVQTATGFNRAEADAAGQLKPRALPMQILDEATGLLIAMCVSAALARQRTEGGSWHVELSLAQTGHWLRGLCRVENGFDTKAPSIEPLLETSASGYGELRAMSHAARLSRTPVRYLRPSMPPGSSEPVWPQP